MNHPAAPPRYSRRPFPEYRYLPGQTPHPTRDPAGHSYASEPVSVSGFSAEDWATCDAFRYGVDLFNRGYWWEAHEAWEACWMAAGRTTPLGLTLQGLIQIAAACLKQLQDKPAAGRRLAADGMGKLRAYPDVFLGFDTPRFIRAVEDYFSNRSGIPPCIRLAAPEQD